MFYLCFKCPNNKYAQNNNSYKCVKFTYITIAKFIFLVFGLIRIIVKMYILNKFV